MIWKSKATAIAKHLKESVDRSIEIFEEELEYLPVYEVGALGEAIGWNGLENGYSSEWYSLLNQEKPN